MKRMYISNKNLGFIGSVIIIFLGLLNTSSSVQGKGAPEVRLNLTIGSHERSNAMSHSKVVVCYLGTWATYRPDEGAYDLDSSFDPTLCTHLIYSFAGLDNKTNELKPLDAYLDLEEEYGRAWYKKANLLKLRHPHLKVLLAVGGWNEGSIKYSKMAEDRASRQTFIKSAVELIRKYGFDGLDLDWEYPGNRDGRPEDKRHFTTLVRELRITFDGFGYMLTGAFGASQQIADSAYELAELSRLMDHIHIMCYDYHGSWDKRTYHNAPLYSTLGDKSVQFSVDYFLRQGVNPKKLVLGLPLYGRTFLLSNADMEGDGLLEDALEKGFQGPYTREDGFLGYNEICKKLGSDRGDWKTYWDPNARVPYMRNGAKWVGFDNPDSLIEKVSFALSRGLKGAMVWSVDTDDFRGSCGGSYNPLLRSINYALTQKLPGTSTEDNEIEQGLGANPKAGAATLVSACRELQIFTTSISILLITTKLLL